MKLIDTYKQSGQIKYRKGVHHDQIVIVHPKGESFARYMVPEYNGVESSDFLANIPDINFRSLKESFCDYPYDFMGNFLFLDQCESTEEVLANARSFAKDMQFTDLKLLKDTGTSTTYWTGNQNLYGDINQDPWEKLENQLYSESKNFIQARLQELNISLTHLTFRFIETPQLSINQRAEDNIDDWHGFCIYESLALIESTELGNSKIIKLLMRVLLRIEAEKNIKTSLIDIIDIDEKELRNFAISKNNLSTLDYIELPLKE